MVHILYFKPFSRSHSQGINYSQDYSVNQGVQEPVQLNEDNKSRRLPASKVIVKREER
jgi:hypothetical protein